MYSPCLGPWRLPLWSLVALHPHYSHLHGIMSVSTPFYSFSLSAYFLCTQYHHLFFFFNILFLIFKALRYRGALLPCWCDAGLHHPFAWLSCAPPWLQFHVLLKRVCEAASFSSKLFFKIPQLPQRAGIHTC